MSRCWCKCEAGLGQCGPKVPRLKSLFGAHQKNDDASLRRGDRQAELQIIWDSDGIKRILGWVLDQEIGEDKSQKLEELRQLIAAAVDKVYDKALEEGVRRRTALEENVMNSEKRLAEILGPESAKLTALGDVDMEFMLSWLSTQEVLQSAVLKQSYSCIYYLFKLVLGEGDHAVFEGQIVARMVASAADACSWRYNMPLVLHETLPQISLVCAPSQLPLQARLDMNMARLHELDSERLGAYGWVGGLVVMVELRHRVLSLRETLNLPPCDPLADLDKVLVSTMEDLSRLYPGKAAPLPNYDISSGEQKPVLQRLQRFYHILRAIESTWVETFVQKKAYRYNGGFRSSLGGPSSDGEGLNDQMEKTAQTCLRKWSAVSDIEEKRNARKRTRDVPRQKSESPLGTGTSSPASGGKSQTSKNKITRPNTPSSEESHSVELLSQNIINKLDTLNQHLKRSNNTTPETSSCSSQPTSGTARSLPETVRLLEQSEPVVRSSLDPQQMDESPPASQSGKSVRTPTSVRTRAANPAVLCSSTVLSERELHHSAEPPIEVAGLPRADLLPCTARENPGLGKIKPADLFGVRIPSIPLPKVPGKSPAREPLRILPNCTTVALGGTVGVQGVKRAGPPPPPPPPPPMPPAGSGFLLLKKQSSNLKRSVKISKLYRNLKTKIEGAAHTQATPGLGSSSSSRRLSTSGTREGMAEALAEITKKSTYFQKIENDVQRYHESIEESKRELDNFETADMEQLLRFHKRLESILENLTDETQVLARFKGFPSNKLETLRLAAALYSRLLSMAQDLEKWEVQAPASEHLDKVTRYFEKIKKDLDVVEGSKDEDYKRFTSQKIKFDFSILGRIKEAIVGVSSRCLIQALEESKRINLIDNRNKGSAPQGYDTNRQRHCSQMLWKAFQLAYRVYNFAGGHDDKSERLISEIAAEIDLYPADVWL